MRLGSVNVIQKNKDFRPINCYIFETIDDRHIVTMEDQ